MGLHFLGLCEIIVADLIITTITMSTELTNLDSEGQFESVSTLQEKQNWILTELATTFSDDTEFLRKINKLTFGLTSRQ